MDIKRLAIGTIVGGVTLYVVGYLIFEVALADFYTESLIDVDSAYRDAPMQWATVSASISYAVLITLGILSRADAASITGGLIAGGVIGFLVWLTADLAYYGLTTLWNLPYVIIDPLLEFVHGAIGGAVIAAVLARVPKTA